MLRSTYIQVHVLCIVECDLEIALCNLKPKTQEPAHHNLYDGGGGGEVRSGTVVYLLGRTIPVRVHYCVYIQNT